MALETVDFRRIVNTDAVIIGSMVGLTGKLALTTEPFDPGIIAKLGASDAPIKFTPDKVWTGSAWALTDKTFGGVTANTVTTGALVASGATTLAATSATVLTASTRATTPEVRAASSAGLTLANSSGTAVALLGAGPGTGVTLYGGLVGTTATFTGAVGTGALSATTGTFSGAVSGLTVSATSGPNNFGGLLSVTRALNTQTLIEGRATSDTAASFAMLANGQQQYGTGSATRDLFTYRSAAGTLAIGTSGSNTAGALQMGALSATTVNGTTAVFTGTATVAAATADGHAVNRVTGDARWGRLASANTWTQTNNFQAVTATTVSGTVGSFSGAMSALGFTAIATSDETAFAARVGLDFASNYVLKINGLQEFGPGGLSARDTFFRRSAVGTMALGTSASNTLGALQMGVLSATGVSIPEGGLIYLKGNESTDGSIRMYASGDDVFFQRRISGTWTNIFTIEG
jgi:hypothetical protein